MRCTCRTRHLLCKVYARCCFHLTTWSTRSLSLHRIVAMSEKNSLSKQVHDEMKKEMDPIVDSKLFRFTKFVKLKDLQPEERLIHTTHLSALQEGKEIYKDPATGYDVLTRLAHLRRGKCCGNACRHCPYGHQNVPDDIPKKRFNSAFYV